MPLTSHEGDRDKQRGQWTIKSPLLTPETLNLFRLAAKKMGQPLGIWAVDRLRRAALLDLGKLPQETPNLPAKPEEVVGQLKDQLEALATKLAQDTEQRIKASEARMQAHYKTLVAQATVAAQDLAENLSAQYGAQLNRVQANGAHDTIKQEVSHKLDQITRSQRIRRWYR